jgi:hypothetical protein
MHGQCNLNARTLLYRLVHVCASNGWPLAVAFLVLQGPVPGYVPRLPLCRSCSCVAPPGEWEAVLRWRNGRPEMSHLPYFSRNPAYI